MRILGTALSIVASMALAIMPIAEAKAMTVQPVVVNLTSQGSGMSQVVKVENTFATRLPVELQIEELRFDGETLVNTHADPGDLLVFPPQAFIEPGQTQTFRIQYVGDPELAKSKHYYVTVAQLPVQLPEGQSAIQILYNSRCWSAWLRPAFYSNDRPSCHSAGPGRHALPRASRSSRGVGNVNRMRI